MPNTVRLHRVLATIMALSRGEIAECRSEGATDFRVEVVHAKPSGGSHFAVRRTISRARAR
jgi:hypothetical protein